MSSVVQQSESIAAHARARVPVGAPPSQNATKVSITPTAITAGAIGSQVTFGVNISMTSALSAFYVTLEYDNTVLNALSVDPSSGIFGQLNPFPLIECINGQPQGSASCPNNPPGNGVDEIAVELALQGRLVNNTSGLLFNVNFEVLKSGLANIHIEQTGLAIVSEVLPTTTADGYFSNVQCGAVLCRPISISLNYTAVPKPLSQKPVKFNVTAADPNGASIVGYQWRWGDNPTAGATSEFTKANKTSQFTTIHHTFLSPGQFFVTVVANDTYGITGYVTLSLFVGRLWVQLAIGSFSASPASQVVAGTPVNVTVSVQNLGTTNQTAQLSVTLSLGIHGNQSLINQTITLLPPNGSYSSSAVLDTTGFNPKAYHLVATAQLLTTNSTFFMNDTSASSHSAYIWLVNPLPGSSLSVGGLAGISIGILIAAYAAFFLIGKLVRRKPEESL
jgi:PKD domain